MSNFPQVILFGSIAGNWREQYIIPVLEKLGITYYNPVQAAGWTPEAGDREAEVLAHCETIVMVFNKTSPSFTGLAETGWAALGAVQRGQHFILQIDQAYVPRLPDSIRHTPDGQRVEKAFQHWTTSSRHLVVKHAEAFHVPTLHVVNDINGVIAALREIYAG